MKEKVTIPILLNTVYGMVLLGGGLVGFLRANSHISLYVSFFFATAFGICSLLFMKRKTLAYAIGYVLYLVLLSFFGYRWMIKQTLMPSGIMTMLTLAFLLIMYKSKAPKKAKNSHL